MPEVLSKIEAGRARGLDVAASIYPYVRASNGLVACFPSWVTEGGTDKMLQRLKDPVQRARAQKEMDESGADWENEWRGSGGGKGVTLIQVLNPELRKYEGEHPPQDLTDIAYDKLATARLALEQLESKTVANS